MNAALVADLVWEPKHKGFETKDLPYLQNHESKLRAILIRDLESHASVFNNWG